MSASEKPWKPFPPMPPQRVNFDPVHKAFAELHQKFIAAGFRPMGDGAMSDSYVYDCSSGKPDKEAIKALAEAMQMQLEMIPEKDAEPTGGIVAHITSALNYAQSLLGPGRKIETQIDELIAGCRPRLIVTERSVKSGGSLSFAMSLDHIFHFHARGLADHFLAQLGNPQLGSAGKCEMDTNDDGDCHVCRSSCEMPPVERHIRSRSGRWHCLAGIGSVRTPCSR